MPDLPAATDSFGTRLRQARQRAGFHTLRQIADTLSEHSIDLSDDAFGHWELGRRPPDREHLLPILALFASRGGFTSLDEINHLLWLLDWRNLNQTEIEQYFRELPLPIRNLPPRPLHYPLVGRDDQLATITDSLVGVNNAVVHKKWRSRWHVYTMPLVVLVHHSVLVAIYPTLAIPVHSSRLYIFSISLTIVLS